MQNINLSFTLKPLAGASVASAEAAEGASLSANSKAALSRISKSFHLIMCEEWRNFAEATGFIVSFIQSLSVDDRPIFWVSCSHPMKEGGELYAPGLAEFGLDPARFLIVQARTALQVLWAMEEALASKAVAAVVGELPVTSRHLNLTTGRRLALRSEKAEIPAYLMTSGASLPATASRSSWQIGPAPSRIGPSARPFLGFPSWRVSMLKNKSGPLVDLAVRYRPSDRTHQFAPPPPAEETASHQPEGERRAARPQIGPLLHLPTLRRDPEWNRR